MGHEIPAGLGIRLHEGDGGEVIVVIGDGTYLMSPTELVTAAQEGCKLTVVVLDNGGYRSIGTLALAQTGAAVGNELRRRGADGRLPDGETSAVDFAANARSMGCEGVRGEHARRAARGAGAPRGRGARRPSSSARPPSRPLLGSGAFWDLGVPEVAARAETEARSAAHRERAPGAAALLMRLATGPVTWGVDFADAPGNPPWAHVLDEIAASGLGALELGPVGYLPEDPDTLRAALASRGLEAVGSFVFEDLHTPAQRRRGARRDRARACAAIRAARRQRAGHHRPARRRARRDGGPPGRRAAARRAGPGGR